MLLFLCLCRLPHHDRWLVLRVCVRGGSRQKVCLSWCPWSDESRACYTWCLGPNGGSGLSADTHIFNHNPCFLFLPLAPLRLPRLDWLSKGFKTSKKIRPSLFKIVSTDNVTHNLSTQVKKKKYRFYFRGEVKMNMACAHLTTQCIRLTPNWSSTAPESFSDIFAL